VTGNLPATPVAAGVLPFLFALTTGALTTGALTTGALTTGALPTGCLTTGGVADAGSAPPVNADTPLLPGAAPPFVAAATTGDVSDTTPTAMRERRARDDRTTFQVSDSHAGMPALHAKLRVL
jgi:hypothetical protein